MPRLLSPLLAVVAVLVATVAVLLGAAPAASAACKTVMTFEFDTSSGTLVLSPSKVTVDAAACVTFNNQTLTSAQFTVGSSYKATAAAFSSATPDYTAKPAGTSQAVTATSTTGSAHATIVIRPAPKPASSPTPKKTASQQPAPNRQSPSPSPSHSPSRRAVPTPTASPPPTGAAVSPPAGSSPFLAGMPTPSASPSSSSGAAVVAGPLQPATNRGTGLPAAVAALAVVATAGGLLRVLLAEPLSAVDDRGRPVGSAV